jgi:hypothetical protein
VQADTGSGLVEVRPAALQKQARESEVQQNEWHGHDKFAQAGAGKTK